MTDQYVPKDYYGRSPNKSGVPEALPEDVSTIEAIIRASYETLSGNAGVPRQWDRMRSLFLPDSRSIRTGVLADGTIGYRRMNTEEFIEQVNDWLVETGFFETEIHRLVEQFGNIAHVFSTYESRRTLEDAKPFMRGINSYQLFHDGQRWWIMTVMWRHESADLPIPARYLPPETEF